MSFLGNKREKANKTKILSIDPSIIVKRTVFFKGINKNNNKIYSEQEERKSTKKKNTRINEPQSSLFKFQMVLPLQQNNMIAEFPHNNHNNKQNTEFDISKNFQQHGHLQLSSESIENILQFNPAYFEKLVKTCDFLFKNGGPLPIEYCHYIAIIASARHESQQLVRFHLFEYKAQKGNIDWLYNPSHCPQKLLDLNEFNELMAHKPWTINKSHIEKLTNGHDKWTLSELMHAVAILSHFHLLATIVDILFAKNIRHMEEKTIPEFVMQTSETQGNNNNNNSNHTESIHKKISTKRNHSTLSAQEFSWEDHGFSLSNNLLFDLGSVLDDKFQTVFNNNLPNFQFLDKNRTLAIKNYVQAIFGIKYDDYDYSQLNDELLNKWKDVIKQIAYYPQRVSQDNLKEFNCSEKIILILVICESRLQATLLHVLHAIMRDINTYR